MPARCRNYSGRLAEGWSEALAWTGGEGLVVLFAAQPRAVAVTWLFSAIMVPPSARSLAPGSMRELRPLCHSFDLPTQGMVADAMDVLAQRVKVLE